MKTECLTNMPIFTKDPYYFKNGFTKVFGEGDPYYLPVLWFHIVGLWEFSKAFGFKSWFCSSAGKLKLEDGACLVNQCDSKYRSLL